MRDSLTFNGAGSRLDLQISKAALLLCGRVRLVRMSVGERLAIDEDDERLSTLLAVAYRDPAAIDVRSHVEAAAACWERGEKTLANLRLVYAGLPNPGDPTLIPRVHATDECSRRTSSEWSASHGREGRDFDVDNPAHMAVARDIEAAVAPLHGHPWVPEDDVS